jgi:transcription elongation factor
MKNSNLFISILCSSFAFAQVGINTTSPQGVLDVTSANSAVVLTRNANPPANVTAPTAGMVIYDSSNKTLRYYNGTQWSTVISSQTLTTANEGGKAEQWSRCKTFICIQIFRRSSFNDLPKHCLSNSNEHCDRLCIISYNHMAGKYYQLRYPEIYMIRQQIGF